jgi:hypothetical protein
MAIKNEAQNTETSSLTIGDTTYKTSGNIVFNDEATYFIAESSLLDKMDSALQEGILENGMRNLLKRFRD